MERIQCYEETLVMQRVVQSPNTSHPSTATSLTNIARVYRESSQLQKALMTHEQSLDMKRAIYPTNAAHHEFVYSFRDLSNVHVVLGSVQETNHY